MRFFVRRAGRTGSTAGEDARRYEREEKIQTARSSVAIGGKSILFHVSVIQ